MGWAVRVVDVTGSTNADLVLAARAGDPGPRVLAARSQTAGRGRLGRRWQSPPEASVALSVLWSPVVPQAGWTWLPAVVGLGVLDAAATLGAPVGTATGGVALKWPNDVVTVQDPGHGPGGGVDGARTGLAKLAGILSEAAVGPTGPAVVLGVGMNLADPDLAATDGPATSLGTVLGRPVTVDEVVPVLAAALESRLRRWEAAGGDVVACGVAEEYRRTCTTLGRRVRARTPGGTLGGTVVDLDPDGSLVLEGAASARVRVSAGDVEHLR